MRNFCLKETNILIPNKKVDMQAFSCVACDQFTSEPTYWNTLKKFVGNKKSALNLILPEIYLNDKPEKRIEKINKNIKEYLKDGVFQTLDNGFVLTIRKTKYKERRIGLIGTLDLEQYDFNLGSKSLIRATEATITDRIPPRLKIRKNAEMEFPHIMVLIDDEKKEILENLYKNRKQLDIIYDFELNMDGGHLTGYYIKDFKKVKKQFSALLKGARLKQKYGKKEKFLFAVGDGNHSLATAKTHWENLKKKLPKKELKNHPARYALVEICNIYDDGIYFEPIHRFVSGVNVKKFTEGLNKIKTSNVTVYDGKENVIKNGASLPDGIKNIDEYIKDYIKQNGGTVDYVHGEKNLKKLVDENKNSVGIMNKKLEKGKLFSYVLEKGVLPKKTFSMGEGIEKRYYLEGRKIK